MNQIEIENMPNSPSKAISYCGKIFSAKESISKAFGFGIGEIIGFHDITIQKDNHGKPFAEIKDVCLEKILNHFDASKISIDISISDSDLYIATSCVVLMSH
jgi:holo-[acyl-carrier protein] synthase